MANSHFFRIPDPDSTPAPLVNPRNKSNSVFGRQSLKTAYVALQGLTKSLIETPTEAAGGQRTTTTTSQREMATSVGYVLGFLFGGFLLARFSRNFIMLLTLQVLGSMLITVPWIGSDWATDTVYIIIGVSIAILMIGK